jgi:hypothetical protein
MIPPPAGLLAGFDGACGPADRPGGCRPPDPRKYFEGKGDRVTGWCSP